jgi:hypothetical protein
MREPVKRSGLEATGLGVVAGAFFAAVGVVVMAARGVDPFLLFRLFASLVMGPAALDRPELGTVLVGAFTNIVVSGAAGFVYGAVNGRLSAETQAHWLRQAGLGVGYGALLYVLDFQLIGRVLFPSVLAVPQLPIFELHTLAFGLPLGLMYAAVERRRHGSGHVPSAA